jgi:hypothetical protein
MTPRTPTAIRPEGARPAPLPLRRRRAGRQERTRGGAGVRRQGAVGQSPGRGDSAKEDRTPGPPAKAAVGDAEPEGPQGQTAVGHEGIARRAPTTAVAQSVPTLAASLGMSLPLGSCPGMCPVLMHVSCARMSPRGLICVSQCVYMGVVAGNPYSAAHRPSLICGVQVRWKTCLSFMGQHVCWAVSVSGSGTVVCAMRFCFRWLSFRRAGSQSLSHSLSVRGCLVLPCRFPGMFSSVSASGVCLVLRHVCRTIYCLSCIFPVPLPGRSS